MSDVIRLFQQYKDTVYRLALSYTRSPQDAEDVCQTVFLKLLERGGPEQGKEKAWLMQVTVNECRNLLKSGWKQYTAPLEDAGPEPVFEWERPEESELFQAVMALKPEQRVVIYLYYYEGYTTRETAALLHISKTAVTTRLLRARRTLRSNLEEGATWISDFNVPLIR